MKTARREKPILFSGEMVRAILAGRKTQTRRAVKLPVMDRNGTGCEIAGCEINSCLKQGMDICPYGQPGDRLWVRETFGIITAKHSQRWPKGTIAYRADHGETHGGIEYDLMRWKPSIFMPRSASRVTLAIESVRAERLHEISGQDAASEGWPREQELFPNSNTNSKAQEWYRRIWESINGKGSWGKNPFVWCLSFRRIDP